MIPLRFTKLGDQSLLFVGDNGVFFRASPAFLDRYVSDALTREDQAFLIRQGFPKGRDRDLAFVNYCYGYAKRRRVKKTLNYFILVPTLRCDLACTYCQVSRVNATASGFDWDDDILNATLDLIRKQGEDKLKIEFQGGEPTLRLDIIRKVIAEIDSTGRTVDYVVCTNLANLTDEFLDLLEHPSIFISTSMDGSVTKQDHNRFHGVDATSQFFENIERVRRVIGTDRLSALPTIDPLSPPSYKEIVESFEGLGINSIYMRPVNYQGFARKQHSHSSTGAHWWPYYEGFVDYVIEQNIGRSNLLEEAYFSHCLRRIFDGAFDGHVDLRNPNPVGMDYLLINHDGRLFPTDEARMLDRIGEIDLSIGDVFAGIDTESRRTLNAGAFNDFDPDCLHCPYQPFCGTDQVDSISRYGRLDLPKHDTYFCQLQTHIFNKIFHMLAEPTPAEARSLSAWLQLPETPPSYMAALDD